MSDPAAEKAGLGSRAARRRRGGARRSLPGCALLLASALLSSCTDTPRPSGAGGSGGAGGGAFDASCSWSSETPSGEPLEAGPCRPYREPLDGSADGSASLDGAPAGVCPTNLPGPRLVAVPTPRGCTYCIDSTEVTNAQYSEFLAAVDGGPPATEAGASDAGFHGTSCTWNSTYVPGAGWPATNRDDYPVASVDWCDAAAYCRWAGKHLCGSVGGGTLDPGEAERTQGEWYLACSSGGTKTYPYGDTLDIAACNLGTAPDPVPLLPVGSRPSCEGGYPGLFDMSGNVAEWENVCRKFESCYESGERCRVGGGSFGTPGFHDASIGPVANGTCGTDVWNAFAPDHSAPDLGFRCCASLP